MRYLINYQPAGCEVKEKETLKEIEFKNPSKGKLANVYLTLNNK